LGYGVQGGVISDGEPIQGVIFSLYSQTEDVSSSCGLESVSTEVLNENWRTVCQTISNPKGQFIFPVVPSGKYKLIPLYQGESIKFDIQPSVVELEVEDGDVLLSQKFEVQGFQVSGRVLESQNGLGLSNALLFLNNKAVATTGESGSYVLENVKTGIYHLTAESDDMGFEELTVRISPNTPSLPDIIASSYKVCGRIQLEDLPVPRQARQVIFLPIEVAKDGQEPLLVSTDAVGVFCQLLSPGLYKLEPMALEKEVSLGLKFLPSSYEVRVVETPLSGFVFSQFRATVSGSISFIGTNQLVTIQLSSAAKATETATTDGSFTFENVLPGNYKVAVMADNWCWRSKSIDIQVIDKDVTDVSFEQLGFVFPVTTSHDVDLTYSVNEQSAGVLNLKAGSSEHCMEQQGSYTFNPESCHVFEPATVEWNTNDQLLVTLTAVKHAIGLTVESDQVIGDLQLTASSANGPVVQLVMDSVKEVSAGRVRHQFSFDGASGETFEIVPSADSLLFFPPTLSLAVKNNCQANMAVILAQKGIFLTGSVQPAIADVQVKIVGPSLAEAVVIETQEDGSFSYGPVNKDGHAVLDLAAVFSITAEKKGYIIRPADSFGHFHAEKLAEISIRIVDYSDEPLSGVLVAAAGGIGYRQNSRSGADGIVTLSELNPGDYFIKPVLKEYQFDPISKLIHIDGGATVDLKIRGERVAFSFYGSVTALNGEPESSVNMVAVGVPGGPCSQYEEEATSETNGQFRLRGLKPQCEYIIQMRTGDGVNKNIQRTLPSSQFVKMENEDVTGRNFVVIRNINHADVVVSVLVEHRDFLKSIKLNLYREDQPDSLVHSVKLEHSPLVILPALPMDGRKYFLQLESNLGRHTYEYSTTEVSFSSNVSVQHVTLQFNARRKMVESETTQVSISTILFILILSTSAYYYQALTPLISRLFVITGTAIRSSKDNSISSSNSSGGNVVFSEQELALMEPTATVIKKKVKPKRAQ